MSSLRPAIFIDRDGTLMEDVPWITNPAEVRLFPGVREALQDLKRAGFRVVMVTNQSGIGRGWMTVAQFEAVQARLLELLGSDVFDGIYMCPDRPDAPSERRKPAPGMIFEAARDLKIDLARSWMIGDKASDVECGQNANVKSVQVRTGEGEKQRSAEAVYFAEGFEEAVRFVLREVGAAS